MNKENELNSKSAPLLFVIFIALLSFFPMVLFIIPSYQLTRAAYCSNFYEFRTWLTTMWCHFISWEFRPDVTFLIIVSFFAFNILFVLKFKKSGYRALLLKLIYCCLFGAVGLLIGRYVYSHFLNEPWW